MPLTDESYRVTDGPISNLVTYSGLNPESLSYAIGFVELNSHYYVSDWNRIIIFNELLRLITSSKFKIFYQNLNKSKRIHLLLILRLFRREFFQLFFSKWDVVGYQIIFAQV